MWIVVPDLADRRAENPVSNGGFEIVHVGGFYPQNRLEPPCLGAAVLMSRVQAVIQQLFANAERFL